MNSKVAIAKIADKVDSHSRASARVNLVGVGSSNAFNASNASASALLLPKSTLLMLDGGAQVYAILRRYTREAKQNVIDVFVRNSDVKFASQRSHVNDRLTSISREIASELGLGYEESFHGVITKLSPQELIEVFSRKLWDDPERLRVQVL